MHRTISLVPRRMSGKQQMPKKYLGFPASASGEETLAITGDIRDASSILGQEDPLEK